MEQATKVMGTLAPLSSTAIWRGSFKDSDISARLKKASTTASSLSQQASTMEQSQTKAEMEGLAARMEQKVAEVSTLQEVLGQVHKSKQILSLVQDRHSADKLTSALPNMDAETVTNVLMTIGGKLSEACAGYLYFFAMQHRTNKVLQCHCAIVCVCVFPTTTLEFYRQKSLALRTSSSSLLLTILDFGLISRAVQDALNGFLCALAIAPVPGRRCEALLQVPLGRGSR